MVGEAGNLGFLLFLWFEILMMAYDWMDLVELYFFQISVN
jgi:hypothetical protein